MKLSFKKLSEIIILTSFFLGLIFFQNLPNTKANVPNDYIANYEVSEDWDKILWLFVEIEATNKLGQNIPESKFSELNNLFESVFPHFPKDYSFQVVYEQCLLTTEGLGQDFTYSKFSMFMDNCYNPFKSIINKIDSNYTIIAKWGLNPKSGPAPLTVTFNASDSQDPSNETIPANNFYRYYRDVDGLDKIIGIGRTINHTFEKPGNYLVHLTVRSSNKTSEWIFDWEKTLSVDVAPKSAVITIYANGQKMNKDHPIKIGVQEAEKWVIFDASATIPIGGRIIESYKMEINGKDWFNYAENGDWSPWIFNIIIPWKWEFNIKLTTIDNEWNALPETYKLIISDPVAILKQTPEEWNTSNIFSFDASASYSVISRIRLFTRELFNQDGEKLETYQGKSIKQQFPKPGSYTIKLTAEDELGKKDISTTKLFVESTSPLAQFSIKPKYNLQYPSEFILDAGLSSDIDQLNGYDSLTYARSFSSPEAVEIIQNWDDNEKILARFNTLWTHKIKLTVQDSYGKITEIEKEIKIESTLRPQIVISPNATTRWKDINFIIKANEKIINYQRDFGDGVNRTLQTNKVSHKYSKVGVYTIKLKVIWLNWMENTIEDLVFIWEKNSPIAHFFVKDKNQTIMTQNDICPEIVWEDIIEHPAYRIDRYQSFTLDTSKSVNVKWKNNNLSFYFQPKNDEIYKKVNFNHNFDELGCQYIDVTVEDTEIGKNDKIRVRFKVLNALPTLDNIILFFPQYGNEVWIGFQENNVKDIFNSNFDPLMVKVQVQDPEDPDGFISYYKRYYYYKDDPTRILETKITPSDVPYAFFSLPRMPGEFMFGVTLYDNDEWRQRSETIIGNWPIVFFPPDVKRPDIPIVTLKADKTTVEVWDEVTFDVISKVISDRPDFIKERTIQYDFDWDGKRDLTTKKDRVTHIYTIANEDWYTPRASIIYRNYKWIWKGGSIIVKKWLKPRLLFNDYWKYVIFRDISLWEIKKKQTCLSLRHCKTDDDYLLQEGMAYDFEYPDFGKYAINMEISDEHANKANKNRILNLTWIQNTGLLYIQAIPEPQIKDDNIEFFVGKNLDNSILYNVHYFDPENQWDCYVDVDITVDSNDDWTRDQDRDFNCNELHIETYEPRYDATIGRIYYQVWDKIQSKDFTINFIDFEIDLDPETEELYKKTQSIIITIDTNHKPNEFLKSMLISLKENLIDQIDTKATVVAIQDYRKTQDIKLTEYEEDQLDSILNQLSDESVLAAQWLNEYEQAKAEILMILPHNLANDVSQLFKEFENTIWEETTWETNQETSQQETRKDILNKILAMISEKITPSGAEQKEDQIDQFDMDEIIMPNMCKIMIFYNLPSKYCISPELQTTVEEKIPEAKKGNSSRLKIVLIILGIIIIAFWWIIVIFAIKAKKSEEEDFIEDNQNDENNEKETEDT